MLFNSASFFVFSAVVYVLYLSLTKRWQDRLLLGASWVFYGLWSWHFLPLLVGITAIDYVLGILLERAQRPKERRTILDCGVAFGLLVLGFFKYYGFFVDNVATTLGAFGVDARGLHLDVVLPLGISTRSTR